MVAIFDKMSRQIHVHVHIVGLNRSLSVTGGSIRKHVIEPLERAPALRLTASLVLIRPGKEVVNPRTGESGLVEEKISAPLDSLPRSFLDQSVLEARTEGDWSRLISRGDVFSDGGNSIRFSLVYLSALKESRKMIPGSPDVIIVLRPDIEIRGRLWIVVRTFRLAIAARFGLVSVLVPAWGNYGGVNDRFAILQGHVAETYITRLNRIRQWHGTARKFDPESFLKFSLRAYRVKQSIYTPMVRIRIGGRTEPRDLSFFSRPPILTRFRDMTMALVRSVRELLVPVHRP